MASWTKWQCPMGVKWSKANDGGKWFGHLPLIKPAPAKYNSSRGRANQKTPAWILLFERRNFALSNEKAIVKIITHQLYYGNMLDWCACSRYCLRSFWHRLWAEQIVYIMWSLRLRKYLWPRRNAVFPLIQLEIVVKHWATDHAVKKWRSYSLSCFYASLKYN